MSIKFEQICFKILGQKMIAIYIEIATLGVGVFIGGVTLMAYFYVSMFNLLLILKIFFIF